MSKLRLVRLLANIRKIHLREFKRHESLLMRLAKIFFSIILLAGCTQASFALTAASFLYNLLVILALVIEFGLVYALALRMFLFLFILCSLLTFS